MTLSSEVSDNVVAVGCLLFHLQRETYSTSHCMSCQWKALCREVNTIIERDASLREAARS